MKLGPGLTFSWKRALGITAAKRRFSRATAERQVDDLAVELSDRFGPLADPHKLLASVRSLLELA